MYTRHSAVILNTESRLGVVTETGGVVTPSFVASSAEADDGLIVAYRTLDLHFLCAVTAAFIFTLSAAIQYIRICEM
ncbi:MAG TPA: hypothetical protein VFC02_24120 [Anaerolineales bacterium]|nr:hypothetical protein [Anaerolineales bacterium]